MRTKAQRLGTVETTGREEALKKAIEHFDIREADRWRLSVQRE